MYICSACNYASTTKLGKCPSCGEFGTFRLDESIGGTDKKKGGKTIQPVTGNTDQDAVFYPCKEEAYHRIFSHGIKQGGVYLIGGEPGIGKSTLVLQILNQVENLTVCYFSGEEQTNEIVRRAKRVIGGLSEKTSLYHTTDLEDIVATIQDVKPQIVVLDSIQTISSAHHDGVAGSPAQIKLCTDMLINICRTLNVTLFTLGHVTKGGEIAGPKYLEHIVDVVCYIDGDRFGQYRTLRMTKNRFGGTDDAIVFAMTESGLQIVGHDFRLHDSATAHEGRVLTIGLENGRPILVHVEALLTKNYNNHPQRNSLGIDSKRLQLIIAILEKYCKCKLYQFDIFVNIPGEFTFYDSGIDVAVAAALYSQYVGKPISANEIYIGEIGLSGQIVKPKLYEKRIGIVHDAAFDLLETVGKRIQDILG